MRSESRTGGEWQGPKYSGRHLLPPTECVGRCTSGLEAGLGLEPRDCAFPSGDFTGAKHPSQV